MRLQSLDLDAIASATHNQSAGEANRPIGLRHLFVKEGKNIDAVIVGIPDFMHATAAMWAMERGKHVYVQKPLTRTIWEARLLAASAQKYRVATQMGNQGYCQEGSRQVSEVIWSGEIGNVTEVHAWTNRPIWPQGIHGREAAPVSGTATSRLRCSSNILPAMLKADKEPASSKNNGPRINTDAHRSVLLTCKSFAGGKGFFHR